MSGSGGGFCVLRPSKSPAEPIAGLAGWSGRRVAGVLDTDAELAQLHSQAERIEAVLRVIRSRIERAESSRRRESAGA